MHVSHTAMYEILTKKDIITNIYKNNNNNFPQTERGLFPRPELSKFGADWEPLDILSSPLRIQKSTAPYYLNVRGFLTSKYCY